ncbi:hypothetical protein F5882DRAFT_475323 [Hyaloscypha sp. PMI_1271]|nr:hypothetical protein F5882DRAFT_475323 [Hyaloscypha sp. PMI_1271]
MLGSRLQILVLLCVLSVANATGLQKYHYEEQSSNILRVRKDPPSPPINSTITTLAPQFFTDQGSKRVKVTYGPFVVPSMDINNGMQNFEYASVNFGCKNCTVTYMEAGLEYPNGTYANANTSLWLHHIVLYNLNNLDTVCGTEETDKAGYYVGPNDTIAFLTELMNTAMVNQTAIVTITYEYLPSLPSNFHKVTPIWMDITGCGGSEAPAKNDTAFQYTSPVWTANATGRVTSAIGHLHDGGVHLDITKNNSTMCDCAAAYGQDPGYVDPSGMSMPGMPMMNMGMHISSLSECSTGQINLGDKLTVTAFYNTTEYMPMTNTDGSLAPIMGIALLYLAQNETYTITSTSKSSSPTGSGVSSSSSHAAAAMVTSGPVLVAGAMGAMVAFGFA